MDPSKKAMIYEASKDCSWRDYFAIGTKRYSEWIPLNKDEYYYIEALHIQGGGGNHMTVSLEIDDPTLTVTSHHHTLRETQRLMITQKNIFEKTVITIDNPDGGMFTLNYVHPRDPT